MWALTLHERVGPNAIVPEDAKRLRREPSVGNRGAVMSQHPLEEGDAHRRVEAAQITLLHLGSVQWRVSLRLEQRRLCVGQGAPVRKFPNRRIIDVLS